LARHSELSVAFGDATSGGLTSTVRRDAANMLGAKIFWILALAVLSERLDAADSQ